MVIVCGDSMCEMLNYWLKTVDDYIWGFPLMGLILSGGLMLTVRLKVIQIRKLPFALRLVFGKNNEDDVDAEGEVTSFAALCTALAATIGTGNIVGVATAISAGGPGALFWMEIAAFIGMATKYAEGLLAVKYRVMDENKHAIGGPFYYIEKGMGPGYKWLARMFAFFGICAGLFGIGTFSQVNSITAAIGNSFESEGTGNIMISVVGKYPPVTVITSVVLTLIVALVLVGGIKRIAKVSEMVVPFMALAYITATMALLFCNAGKIPESVALIVKGAFAPKAVGAGAAGTMYVVMQKGVARGIFSNESGLGSAPIAAAAAKTKEPVQQGLVSMTGTFIDTIIICTMTGLSIVVTGAWKVEGLQGVEITAYAFNHGLPLSYVASSFLIMICLIFFAFTTILGWNYYSERCLEYLTGRKNVVWFRWVYVFVVFVAPYISVTTVWMIADIFNGLMAVPNMIAIFSLSKVVTEETKNAIDQK